MAKKLVPMAIPLWPRSSRRGNAPDRNQERIEIALHPINSGDGEEQSQRDAFGKTVSAINTSENQVWIKARPIEERLLAGR